MLPEQGEQSAEAPNPLSQSLALGSVASEKQRLATLLKPRFDFKVGCSELISLVAIIVAVIGYFVPHEATKVTVTARAPKCYLLCNKGQQKWNYVARIPLIVANNGGKPVTLAELSKDPDRAPVLAYDRYNNSRPAGATLYFPRELSRELGQGHIDLDEVRAEDIESQLAQQKKVLVNIESVPGLAVDYYHNLTAGEAVSMIVSLRSDSFQYTDRFIVSLDFHFGDEKTIFKQVEIKVNAPLEGKRCP